MSNRDGTKYRYFAAITRIRDNERIIVYYDDNMRALLHVINNHLFNEPCAINVYVTSTGNCIAWKVASEKHFHHSRFNRGKP
jgi:hypothetical protein